MLSLSIAIEPNQSWAKIVFSNLLKVIKLGWTRYSHAFYAQQIHLTESDSRNSLHIQSNSFKATDKFVEKKIWLLFIFWTKRGVFVGRSSTIYYDHQKAFSLAKNFECATICCANVFHCCCAVAQNFNANNSCLLYGVVNTITL